MKNRNLPLGRRSAALASAFALATGLIVAGAPAASAAGKDGVCQSGELCLYYNSNYGGRIFDLYVNDSNFSGDVFPGTTTSANNNTASYFNADTYTWYVYTGANRSGSRGNLPPGHYGNFSSIYKNTVSSAYYHL